MNSKTQIKALTLEMSKFKTTGQAPPNDVQIAPDGSGYRYVASDGKTVSGTGRLDGKAMKAWLLDGGMIVDPSTVDAEAEQLASFINAVIDRQPKIKIQRFSPAGSSSGSSGGPAGWWLTLVLIVAVAIWLFGVVFYWRRHRQDLALASAPPD